jgi:hypothetical protein
MEKVLYAIDLEPLGIDKGITCSIPNIGDDGTDAVV